MKTLIRLSFLLPFLSFSAQIMAHSGNNGVDVIHACIDKKTRIVRVLASNAAKCKRKETPSHWNIAGPSGAIGAIGLTGAQGSSGVIEAASNSGAGSNPGPGQPMLTTPLTVAISGANQKIYIAANKVFGSTGVAGGADGLSLAPCYRLGSSGILNLIGDWIFVSVLQNEVSDFGVTGVTPVLAVGSYQVGMCGGDGTNAANWNDNDFGYTSAIVIQD